jgi:hypothetical protein
MISLLAMGFKDYARAVPRCFIRLNPDAEDVARKNEGSRRPGTAI